MSAAQSDPRPGAAGDPPCRIRGDAAPPPQPSGAGPAPRGLVPRPVPDVAAYLLGRWDVERVVRDLRSGEEGGFRGTAVFRPAGEGPAAGDGRAVAGAGAPGTLVHVEEGELEWGGAVHRAGRTLRLRPCPDGSAEVDFADGRPFHDLDLRTGRWHTVHPCAADRYEGTFTVVAAGEWHLEWRVSGPAKDQALRSVYRRR